MVGAFLVDALLCSDRRVTSFPRGQAGKSCIGPIHPFHWWDATLGERGSELEFPRFGSQPTRPSFVLSQQACAVGIEKRVQSIVLQRFIRTQPMLPKISLPIFGIANFTQNLCFPLSHALTHSATVPQLTQNMDMIRHDRGSKECTALASLMPRGEHLQDRPKVVGPTQPRPSGGSDESDKIADIRSGDATKVKTMGLTP